jgi:hypothetical protein
MAQPRLQISISVVAEKVALIPNRSQFNAYTTGRVPLPPKTPVLNKPGYGNLREMVNLQLKNEKLRTLQGFQ